MYYKAYFFNLNIGYNLIIYLFIKCDIIPIKKLGDENMEQYKIDRINELFHKSKDVGLSEEERQEQAQLRKEYIESVKSSLILNLSNTYIIDEQGNKKKLNIKR